MTKKDELKSNQIKCLESNSQQGYTYLITRYSTERLIIEKIKIYPIELKKEEKEEEAFFLKKKGIIFLGYKKGVVSFCCLGKACLLGGQPEAIHSNQLQPRRHLRSCTGVIMQGNISKKTLNANSATDGIYFNFKVGRHIIEQNKVLHLIIWDTCIWCNTVIINHLI